MKNIQSLTKTVEKWRQVCSAQYRQKASSQKTRSTGDRDNRSVSDWLISLWPFKLFDPKIAGESKTKPTPIYYQRRKGRSAVSLIFAVICLTGVIGTRFYNQPKLAVGTPAPTTIIAPSTARFPDQKTTEEMRKAAQRGSIPILKIDVDRTEQIQKNLQRYLNEGDRLREIAGVFPFTPTQILSESSQIYLRTARPWEWLRLLAEVKQNHSPQSSPNSPESSEGQKFRNRIPIIVQWAFNDQRFSQLGNQAVAELKAYRDQSNTDSFNYLIDTIMETRQRYLEAIAALSSAAPNSLTSLYADNDRTFLNLSDTEWQKTKQGIQQTAQLILAQGIPEGLPPALIENAVKLQLRDQVPIASAPLASKILFTTLKPNLTEDFEATSHFAKQAVEQVKTVYVSIQEGEVIVKAGELIEANDLVLLDGFDLSQRGVNWMGLMMLAGGMSVAVGIFWLVEHKYSPPLRRRDHLLVLLLTLSSPLLLYLKVPVTSLPAIGLLIGNFYGSILAATIIGLVGLLLPVGMEVELSLLLANVAGGLLAGIVAGKMRAREELALLGLGVGLMQAIVYLIVTLILSAHASAVWYSVLMSAALQGLIGVAWSVIALGVSPYLEQCFDLITPIRLAELSNLNRPLLKRLAAEAPGTFQHTLFVSSLAEAAGKELGCNVELIRAGTLYHDIGKMHDPLGFIENQMGGINKHDEIDNPWESATIIQKHVTQGLVMAKRSRLPKALQAFIPEHQGTMLIAYFYHQAQQRAAAEGKPPVSELDFRYRGPIPQSRETGIVMLADSCEAALRSLKDTTPEEALNMVNKIFRARWQDNQLVDSGLRREEMPKIAEIFVRVWQQFNHKRIAYPKAALQSKR
jgi:putative nucleotidyltransferase with HDIG domain